MESLILAIIQELKATGGLSPNQLSALIRKHNKNITDNKDHFAKKQLLPYCLRVKENDPALWDSWNVDEATEKLLFTTLMMKPRRTASGVATITVITKPHACSNNCLYCPNDVRMPKSYLSNEPACQRAERNFFDPFLQVATRLRALKQMGHNTDKIELILLGGTWSDYSESYQIWFMCELFRALNCDDSENEIAPRHAFYEECGFSFEDEALALQASPLQQRVHAGDITYNDAVRTLYGSDTPWGAICSEQVATFEELEEAQRINETAKHRMVGLVIETRPDTISLESARTMRRLGCTKVQMGIQSLDSDILALNHRAISIDKIAQSFEILRAFGFKVHVHFMLNLLGSTPLKDKADYLTLVTDKRFLPDEVKIYPCSLIADTGLVSHYEDGSWQPYNEEDLINTLVSDILATPRFMRISRMIRDISACDIMVGNKKSNLRQLVENKLADDQAAVAEIRYREINNRTAPITKLTLKETRYETASTQEYFLEWVTPENVIAGFLRLSLPAGGGADRSGVAAEYPHDNEAMIREVHVYGKAAQLRSNDVGTQHSGLGKQLVRRALDIACEKGFMRTNVISSVGTREYYRSLGFEDNGLYQQFSQ